MTETPRRGLEASAMTIVYRYMAVSAGAALIPVPGIDTTILAGVHVALIKQLCDHYGVSFTEHTARNVLIAVVGGLVPGTIGSLAGRKVLRLIPSGVRVLGWAVISASSAALSYAIGRLFIHHFESGGTLLSLEPRTLHEVFFHRPKPAELAAAQ